MSSNDDDGLSSSQLFRFDISSEIESLAVSTNKFYAENYVTNIYALGIHDNDPSASIQPELAQKRSKLGIIGMKFRHGIYNLNAVNAEAYFITTFPDNDDLVVNYDYCSFYNSWSNHIMTWALNSLDMTCDDKFDGAVHEGYQPITLNITNSFMGKCGGPVIITVNKSPSEDYNKEAGSKNIVNIDDKTNIFSYVKGTESWFDAYEATSVATYIMNLNKLYPSGSSFVTTVNKNSFINMIILNMEAGFIPGSDVGATNDLDGSLSIGGSVKLDMNDTDVGSYGHGGIVDAVHQGAQALGYPTMPPVFVSDLGGASYTDGVNLYIADIPGLDDATDKYLATQGNYLSLYMYNLGVLLGFNESELSAEPTPADCTVERITAPHGIN